MPDLVTSTPSIRVRKKVTGHHGGGGGRGRRVGPGRARWFRHAGGMSPITLCEPTGRYPSFPEREEIAILHAQEHGVREIARRLGRDPSTISRELRRNAATRAGQRGYRAAVAQWKAQQAAKRPKVAKLAADPRLRAYVEAKLSGALTDAQGRSIAGPNVPWAGRRLERRQDRRWAVAWSPEQISGRLKIDFPDDESMRVSHETIYQSLYVQGRNVLARELTACLRTGRALREPRVLTRRSGRSFVTEEINIFSRYVVAWTVQNGEDAQIATTMLKEAMGVHGIPDAVHADRGTSMTSKPVAQLLLDLGVDRSHSRPRVSNDNPFSEAAFKTLKYAPAFPEAFGSLADARAFCDVFFGYYNHEHRHSGSACTPPRRCITALQPRSAPNARPPWTPPRQPTPNGSATADPRRRSCRKPRGSTSPHRRPTA